MPELKRQAFEAIAECTYDWESWVGPDGELRWLNPAVERMTGWKVEQCLKMDDYPLALVHPQDRQTVATALAGAAHGTSGNDLEFRLIHREGATRWGAMSWQPLTGARGDRLGYRTSVRDITERKRIEQQLRAALLRAEQADRTRAAFLANISHELRTPIHNLLGYAQLLRGSELDPKQRHWVDIVAQQGDALLALVEDLLDLSASDAKRVPRKRALFDAGALLRRTVEAQRPRFAQKKVKLVARLAETWPSVFGDQRAVEQIVRNLLENAYKFTDHGRVTVEAAVEQRDGQRQLVIAVGDTGVGMDPDQVDQLRKPFVRGDSTSSPWSGSGVGLGLAIVDRLVTQLGGSLQIETAAGRGSRFVVRLPAPAEAPEPSDQDAEQPPVHQRVLVVDDEPLGRELAREFLGQLSCACDTADSARQAVSLCSRGDYDLILIDLHMPEIDGVSATNLLRALLQQRGRMPRIVAMTADVFGATAEGFDGHLVKPVQLDSLRQCLRDKSRSTWQAHDHDRLLGVIDRSRIEELRSTQTADGQSFWDRFGLPAMRELETLARQISEIDPEKPSSTALAHLAHRVKNAAALLGATRLAQQAQAVQDTLDQRPTGRAPEGADELLDGIAQTLPLLAAEIRPSERG